MTMNGINSMAALAATGISISFMQTQSEILVTIAARVTTKTTKTMIELTVDCNNRL